MIYYENLKKIYEISAFELFPSNKKWGRYNWKYYPLSRYWQYIQFINSQIAKQQAWRIYTFYITRWECVDNVWITCWIFSWEYNPVLDLTIPCGFISFSLGMNPQYEQICVLTQKKKQMKGRQDCVYLSVLP